MEENMDESNKSSQRAPYGILAILMIGAFIAFLNNTLLNVALPSIMNDFDLRASTAQWLVTGFMLVNGIMIPTTAFLIEKYSVRHLFLVAIGLFTLGTALAGFSPVFLVLITGRMIQASGSAIMMPLLMNVMLVSFPVHKRGAAMGIFGLILMAAPAIGPTLSGIIIQHYHWRMLFHFIAPIAILVLLLGFFLLKDKKEKQNIKIDRTSLLLSTIGFGGVLFGFSSAGDHGFGNLRVYGTIIVGTIALIMFVLRQRKLERPMLNFKVFSYPMFSLASATTMIVNMALFSGMLLLPIYVQTLRGISPIDAGLLMLPGAVVMALMSPITGRLFDKIGGRILALTGLTIMIITTYLFSQLTFETTYSYLIVLNTVRSFGMSMVMMPVQTNGLNQLPRSYYPHGTAMNNTLNQIAGAVGTGVLITVMSVRTDTYASKMISEATAKGQELTESVLAQIEATAMLGGINDSFFLSAIFIILALILSFFMKRAKPSPEPEATVEQN